MSKLGMAAAALVGLLVWNGCGNDDPTGTEVPVASVDVAPEVDTLRAGTTIQLQATPRDASDNPLSNRTITWSSDDESVATVDGAGAVTGVSMGTATIGATSEGQTSSADITVWVGVTGSWSGFIEDAPAGTCPLDPSITEDASGDVTGTAALGSPCTEVMMTAAGLNGVDGVADSVSLTFTVGGESFVFEGTFDGDDSMTGLTNGAGCTDCSTSFFRTSIAPASVAPSGALGAPARERDQLLDRK